MMTARGGKRINLGFFQDLLKDYYPNLTIKELKEAPGSERGDNYTSMLYRVQLNGIILNADKTETPWTKSIIYKCLPENEFRRDAFKSVELFQNEARFYNKVLPTFLEFQSLFQDKVTSPFAATPKCYLAENDLLVLEDLHYRGFSMADRKKSLSFQQCCAVLKVLAHYHALSLTMKNRYPEQFYELVHPDTGICEVLFTEENEEWYREYFRSSTRNALSMVVEELSGDPDKDKYIDKFSEFTREDQFYRTMMEFVVEKGPLSVICHGDTWTNNIMFRYSDDGQRVLEVSLLDFQVVRYCSLGLDLVYLIYCCISTQERAEHLEHLLEIYTQNLHSRILELTDPEEDNCVLGELMQKNVLQDRITEEFHRCSPYGLGLALDMIPIMTCDSEEAPDLYEATDGNADGNASNVIVWTSNKTCKRKMAEIVKEIVDNGFL